MGKFKRASPFFVSERMRQLGQIIILNGAPRSGKSSIALAIQATFPGEWEIFGVDRSCTKLTPVELFPGIGLRPGGERPDLEPFIVEAYQFLHTSIANLSRQGTNVAVDIGYHDSYSQPLSIRAKAADRLLGLPVLFVGVRCSIEEIMIRRNQGIDGSYVKGTEDDPFPEPVKRWQEEVHKPGIYDIEVDTSVKNPTECAERIKERLESGKINNAFWLKPEA